MWYQNNSLFYTDFKNLYVTLEKSAPKKNFAQKPDFFPIFNGKNSYIAYTSLKTFWYAIQTIWRKKLSYRKNHKHSKPNFSKKTFLKIKS